MVGKYPCSELIMTDAMVMDNDNYNDASVDSRYDQSYDDDGN